jgi:hypothetical protein
MMGARELALSLLAQGIKQWNGQSERVEPEANQLHTFGLGDVTAERAILLEMQQGAWAKLSILQSPREIAWARCKTLRQNALES